MSAAESPAYLVGYALAQAQEMLEASDDPQALLLLRAAAHQWGPGKVHLISEHTSQTQCGRPLVEIPGEIGVGHLDLVDCQVCQKSRAAHVRMEAQRAQWEERQREYRDDRQREDAEWRRRYNAYLQTPAWQSARSRVLERANGTCEGCLQRRATQVHHLHYRRMGAEMLFDLVAVCDECHDRIHSGAS